MSDKPSVCCIMLANGRPDMVRRAVRSFQAQSYDNRMLMIFDSGAATPVLEFDPLVHWIDATCFKGNPIGTLRNRANSLVSADIICHWDSDDWSHPRRIEEQVGRLSLYDGHVDCVGYGDMIFMSRNMQAWLYSSQSKAYCLGTSMCYWRRSWERRKFEDIMVEEDLRWLSGVRSIGLQSVDMHFGLEPRMIATIHGANTTANIDPSAREWKRVPEWDEYCREVLSK